MRSRHLKTTGLIVAAIALAVVSVGAQTPAQTSAPPPQRPAGKAGARPGGPGGELNLQTVQSMVDAWALVEAQQQLELTEEQTGTFVTRMMRVQNLRRRHMMERQRLLREMGAIAFGGNQPRPDDAALTEKLKTFDDLTLRTAQELRLATQELDAILTPYQRVRFRVFEERIERQKLDMLMRARGARGDGTAPVQPQQKGRGGH
jgi:hypothetical protein